MSLVTTPNLTRIDDVYERLIEIHAGLSDEDSARLNARLILILLNHIGDPDAIFAAMTLAAETGNAA